MALIGIKCSVVLSLISIWGIIQLAVMGGLLKIHSVAFAEDFEAESLEEVEESYDTAVSIEANARTCRQLFIDTICHTVN